MIDRLVPVVLWAAFGGGLIYVAWCLIVRREENTRRKNELIAQIDTEENEAAKAVKVIRGIIGLYSYPTLQADKVRLDSSDYQATVDAVRQVAEQVAVMNARKQAAEK